MHAIVVWAAEAARALEFDPAPAWEWEELDFAINGAATALAVGDFDGDGVDDVALTTSNSSSYVTSVDGRVVVFYGDGAGLAASPDLSFVSTWGSFTQHGASAVALDVHGDGYDDLVVGAYDWPGGSSYGPSHAPGAIVVYRGGSDGLDPAGDLLAGDPAETNLGVELAPAGDVDRDGDDDLLVLGTEWWLFLGGSTGPVRTSWSHPNGYGGGARGVGDANGDGFDDVAMLDAEMSRFEGQVALDYGGPAGPDGVADWTVTGGFGFGTDAAAGDVDGDGLADLLVATGAGTSGSSVTRFAGTPTGPGAVAVEEVVTPNGQLELSVPGDLDGDGVADLVLGTFQYSGPAFAWVVPGDPGGLAPGPWAEEYTVAPAMDSYNLITAATGDFDGDGALDRAMLGLGVRTDTYFGTDIMSVAAVYFGEAPAPVGEPVDTGVVEEGQQGATDPDAARAPVLRPRRDGSSGGFGCVAAPVPPGGVVLALVVLLTLTPTAPRARRGPRPPRPRARPATAAGTGRTRGRSASPCTRR